MAKEAAPQWQRAIVLLCGTVMGVVVVGCLYWARPIFVPLALAIFFSFLLNPLVSWLEGRRVGRAPSVILVVLLATLALGAGAWIATRQMISLVAELPEYRENIKAKVKSLRSMTESPTTNRLGKLVREISGELEGKGVKPPMAANESLTTISAEGLPTNVVVQPERPAWIGQVAALVGSLTELLGVFLLAAVLTIFVLLKREMLRNRLIRLIGQGRMTATTKAFDEATQRISRFLLVQLIVNGGYGLTLAAGLLMLGVEYALLWGFLAAAMRYIPYIGAWIAAAPPIFVAVVMSEGWMQPLCVLGLIAVLELILNNVIEPWFFGHSMGVSEVALLVAAGFWALLWGPIGLVLSSPLTVCLVVLGKYVPQLEFVGVLLGDDPGLEPDMSLYQRLLARDKDEAMEIALSEERKAPGPAVYDQVLVPALSYALRDRAHYELTEEDEAFMFESVREIAAQVGTANASFAAQASAVPSSGGPHCDLASAMPAKVVVLACPARDEADQIALEMLKDLLDPSKWDLRIAAIETLAAELVDIAIEQKPGIICIGSMGPGGLAHTRYLCKRLRGSLPDAHIVVGRWGVRGDVEKSKQLLRAAGADEVQTTLLDMRNYLSAWLPVLQSAESVPAMAARTERAAAGS